MKITFCDEWEHGFGWIAPKPAHLERAGHALEHDGSVWLVDPVDVPGLDDRVAALGKPVGVVQLLGRHRREAPALANRLGVPLHVVPPAEVADSPFRTFSVVNVPTWREVALWWPEERTVVFADAIGSAGYYVAPGERLAVHPFLRLTPPRRLGQLEPRRVLVGHGEGVAGDYAAGVLADALASSRRRIPRWLRGLVRSPRARESG